MYYTRTSCRACGYGTPAGPEGIKSTQSGEKLIEVFDLGVQPLANDFVKIGGEHKGYAPLKVMFCPRCTLSQLSVVVKPSVLYENYCYETSKSETMRLHFRSLWDAITEQAKAGSVIEIGSNDGDFLAFARQNGAEAVCGVDPAENLALNAIRNGIPTVIGILDEKTAECAARVVPKADVIVARHVLAHADDWTGFVNSLDTLSNKDTLVVIECPYVLDMLEGSEFDTVYHEHLSYVSLKSIHHLLHDSVFHLHKVKKFPVHGGAIVMMLRRNDSETPPDRSVVEFMEQERITVDSWMKFSGASRLKIERLKHLVDVAFDNKTSVVGFGASAKSTVWINACGFTKRDIGFICDNTPHKQLKFSPGSDIPIVDEGALLRELPYFAVCFAWNFMDEIVRKNMMWIDKGGQFINPHAL